MLIRRDDGRSHKYQCCYQIKDDLKEKEGNERSNREFNIYLRTSSLFIQQQYCTEDQ